MNGDIPCGKVCHNWYCQFNFDGWCMDNATCDERILEGGTE